MALEAGCHVFTEKPLAESAEQCRELVELAAKNKAALVVGYILRQHPSWIKFGRAKNTQKTGYENELKPAILREKLGNS